MSTACRRMYLVAVLASGMTEKNNEKQAYFIEIICYATIKIYQK
jgi:hypothetical protein